MPWQKEVPGMPKKKEADFDILKALENVHINPSTLLYSVTQYYWEV